MQPRTISLLSWHKFLLHQQLVAAGRWCRECWKISLPAHCRLPVKEASVRHQRWKTYAARWPGAMSRNGSSRTVGSEGDSDETKTKGLQNRIGASSRGWEASLTGWFNFRSKQHAIVRSNDRSVIERSAGRINQSQLQDRTRVRPYTCTVLWSNETKPFRNKRISYTARTKQTKDASYVQECVCVCVW